MKDVTIYPNGGESACKLNLGREERQHGNMLFVS